VRLQVKGSGGRQRVSWMQACPMLGYSTMGVCNRGAWVRALEAVW
jgi:hypothetical protein